MADPIARQCPLCEAHCGILVHLESPDGHEVARIEGDPEDVLSRGYICPKGTTLAALHTDPDRLRTPMKRVGTEFVPVSWKEAFAFAGERLRAIRAQHGRDAIGAYFGNPTAHSSAVLASEGLKKVLGSRNIYSAASVDQFPQYLTSELMFGDHTILPVADIDRTDHLLIIGANPAVSNGSITTMPDARGRIRAVRKRGGRVVVIDPRRTETARLADEHVAVRPGGDAALLMAMLHVVFEQGYAQAGFPTRHTSRLRETVASATPEWAAPRCGIDASTIERLAVDFATARSAVAYGRIGVCHQETGTLVHFLINALNAVTGNLDRAGGAMFPTPPADLGRILRLLWGPSTHGTFRSRTSGLPDLNGELPVAALPEEAATPGPRQLRAMIVAAGNPARSAPDSAAVTEALEGLDFLVCVDMYLTETTRHADLVLPPVSHLERAELDIVFPNFSVHNNVRYSPAALDPEPGGLEDWDILLGLATELLPTAVARAGVRGLLGVVDSEKVIDVLIATGPQGRFSKDAHGGRRGRSGLTGRRVRETRGGVDLGPLEPRLASIIQTRSGAADLAPPDVIVGLRGVLNDAAPEAEDDSLVLIGRRQLRSNNSWLHNVPAMVKGKERCTAMLHPDDASSRGIGEGDEVTISSALGSVVVPVEITDEVRPGVVSVPHGWGHTDEAAGWTTANAHPGTNINAVVDRSVVDRLSGNAAMNATRVRVTPLRDGRPSRASGTETSSGTDQDESERNVSAVRTAASVAS